MPDFQQDQRAYAQSVGTATTNAPHIDTRDPNPNDINYPIGKFWVNTVSTNLWYLNSQNTMLGYLQSLWIEIEATSIGDISKILVDIASGTGVNPVVPDNHGQITLTGNQVAAGTVGADVIRTDTTEPHSITIEIQRTAAVGVPDASLNGVAHFNSADFTVDSSGFVSTNPSTEIETITGDDAIPIGPTGNNINLHGVTVANATNAKPLFIDGDLPSTLEAQIQVAAASASSNINNSGLASFNNTQFSVDANGFVALSGGAAIEKIALQTGTSPIVPLANVITFNGATVPPGTNPVKTDGTDPNTMALEVQISQAVAAGDATKIGLANFNSTQFDVSPAGFVTFIGSPGPGSGVSVAMQVFTASGIYTPTPGMTFCIIEAVGGGGNGANAHGAGTPGGGGGAGGYVRLIATATTIGVSQPVVIGGPGANTTVGALLTSGGGGVGGVPAPLSSGGAGGSASGGNVNIVGSQGGAGGFNAGGNDSGGNGGNSYFGGAGSGGVLSNSGTNASANSGSGGGGSSGSSSLFGLGASGIVVITEYVSSGARIAWLDASGAFPASVATGYFITAAATATLPPAPLQGDTVSFVVDTAALLTIQANAGQTIRISNTTSSVAGTATNTLQGDSIDFVFRAFDNTWFNDGGNAGGWNLA